MKVSEKTQLIQRVRRKDVKVLKGHRLYFWYGKVNSAYCSCKKWSYTGEANEERVLVTWAYHLINKYYGGYSQ